MGMELIIQIFEVCIIPLLGVLTTYFIKWLNAHMAEVKAKTDDVKYKKYMTLLEQTITDCVIATNQTYVESLKAQGNFTIEAQKEAFKKSTDAVMAILTEDAQEYLASIVGDLEIYITKKVEASVNKNKIKNVSSSE